MSKRFVVEYDVKGEGDVRVISYLSCDESRLTREVTEALVFGKAGADEYYEPMRGVWDYQGLIQQRFVEIDE